MIGVIIILSLILVYCLYTHFKNKDLFEKVKWCVTSDSLIRMKDQILRLQYELEIDDKYRITETEIDIVIGILQGYQKALIQEYFNGSLLNGKFVADAWFVTTLGDFLGKHQLETTFNGNEMYTTKDYEAHGCWGMDLFTATYVLTDYAVAYNKLFYISWLYYLKLHKIVGDEKVGVIIANGIREAIDNGEIKVGRG